MALIFRYLAKETYTTMLAVTSILVLIFMSHQFVHYLGDAAVGRLTPKAVLQLMCIQIPLLLGFMLPLGLFLGILLSYGRFYVDNEMTILTACGISKGQILKMSLMFASLVTLMVAVIMWWVEPTMAKHRNEIIAKAAASSPIERIAPGRFQLVGDWILYTEGITRDRQKMSKVFAANIPKPDITGLGFPSLDVVTAEHAFEKKTDNNSFIVLANGHRYLGVAGRNKYQIVKFDEYGVRLPGKLPEANKKEEYMSIVELLKQRTLNRMASAELQWRMAMPISVIVLTFFAVPLSEVKPRKGKFSHLFPAIVIYITYTDLLFLGRAWIESGKLPAEIGMWWIHGSMLLFALGIIYVKLPLRYKNYKNYLK